MAKLDKQGNLISPNMWFDSIIDYFENQTDCILVKVNNKNYIIYTENNDSKDVYASTFEINDNELKLHEIENDSEWDYVDSILSNIGEE